MDRGVSILEATIAPAADGWRLDRALADAVPTLSRERLKVLIASGAVTIRETVKDGIEAAPEAFLGLFAGDNIGKMLVRV